MDAHHVDAAGIPPYNHRSGCPWGARGYTLTEVLVALGVLAIGAVAAISLFAAAAATHKRAIDRMNSAYLAEQVIDQVESRLVGDVPLQDLEVEGASLEHFLPGYIYDVDLEDLEPETGLGLEVLVEVTVRWRSRGQSEEAVFQTILLRSLGEEDILGVKKR